MGNTEIVFEISPLRNTHEPMDRGNGGIRFLSFAGNGKPESNGNMVRL